MIRYKTRRERLLKLGDLLAVYEFYHPGSRIKFGDITSWITTPSGEPKLRINADYTSVLRDVVNKRDAGTLYPLASIVDTIKARTPNAVKN